MDYMEDFIEIFYNLLTNLINNYRIARLVWHIKLIIVSYKIVICDKQINIRINYGMAIGC